jgi:hypothetical protein
VQRLLDPPALLIEVGEHVERLGPSGERQARGGGRARCCGATEESSFLVEEEASPWPTS